MHAYVFNDLCDQESVFNTYYCSCCLQNVPVFVDCGLLVLNSWTNPEKKGLMFMETSALDSTNVEAAFNEVLTGRGSVALLKHVLHFH